MKSIRSFANARELAEKFVNEKLEIQLWDTETSNRIMCYIRKDEDRNAIKVAFIDTVNGTETIQNVSISEIEEAIWHNRKYINQSGQLKSL